MTTSFVSLKTSVIVYNLNVPRVVIDPTEADAPLVIYSDAHLADTVTLEDFQSISGWISQVLQGRRGIQLAQLAQSAILNIAWKLPARLPLPNTLRMPAPE
jgi:hypothetical protein